MKDSEATLKLVNASCDAERLAYKISCDPIHGRCDVSVEIDEKCLVIDRRAVALLRAHHVAVREYGVEDICESAGISCTDEKIEPHLTAGGNKVVFSAPAIDDSHTIVTDVVKDMGKTGMTCASCASCATNGLAQTMVVDPLHPPSSPFLSAPPLLPCSLPPRSTLAQ